MELHEHEILIACVEGWSANAAWRGVRMSDLLAAAGVEKRREVDVVSL
jgi:DMSO/TMAO reductase YedYZ molybdopterin-dependent catalytic subunit